MSKSHWIALMALSILGCAKPAPPAPPKRSSPSITSPSGETPLDRDKQPSSVPSNGLGTETESTPNDKQETKPETPEPTDKKASDDSVTALLAKATLAAQSQDFDEGIRIVGGVLEREPTNRAGLSLMARMAQAQGMRLVQTGEEEDAFPLFSKSAKAIRKLRELDPNLDPLARQMLPVIFYNEACAYCQGKEPDLDKAVAAFKDAVDAGFDDLAQIDEDTDLDPIRDRDDFKEIRARVEGNKK
jgi:hypothetical protein